MQTETQNTLAQPKPEPAVLSTSSRVGTAVWGIFLILTGALISLVTVVRWIDFGLVISIAMGAFGLVLIATAGVMLLRHKDH